MSSCDFRLATHVGYKGEKHRIVEKWGIDAEGHLAKLSEGGFGCITDTGLRVGAMEAENYYKEDLNAEAPEEVRELELYAWVGRDEHGSGKIGLKQANAPAGLIPMVAISRDKVEEFYPQFEAIAKRYGQRIYLVKLKAVEVVRGTMHGV